MIFGNAPSTEPMVEAWKDLNWKIYRLGKRDNLEKALDLRVVEPAVKPPMEFYAPLYFPQVITLYSVSLLLSSNCSDSPQVQCH
jgi:hypothetical protein